MSSVHVFVRCVPNPQDCLMPNEKYYKNDERIEKLKEILCNEGTYICIIGVTDDDITKLYREMIALSSELNNTWLKEPYMTSITDYKKIFWFKNMGSFETFEDVYSAETNELIIEQYNRIFESVAGNNLCITLNDCRGMICRLPYDMSAVAKTGTLGLQNFQ